MLYLYLKSKLPVKNLLWLFYFLAFSFSYSQIQKTGKVNSLSQKLEKGISLLSSGKIDEAEFIFTEISKKAISNNELYIYAKAETNLGRIFADRGNNVLAIKHYQNALDKAEGLNDKELIAPILKNIGILYVSWKNFDKAIQYYNKAEILAKELGNNELVADCQNNKGIVYEQREEYEKAIQAYKNALAVYTEKNIPDKISMTLSNLAIVYKYLKNYPESLNYNFMALKLAEKTDDKWMMAAILNNIGNLYGVTGQYKNAILYCEKAIVLSEKIDAKEIIYSTYDSMAEAAAIAGDYKNAFEYHKKFTEAKDRFINLENTRQLSELNVKYETEKKQKLIQKQQLEITTRNAWLLVSGIMVILIITAGYFIFLIFKNRRKKQLNEEIQKQQQIAGRALFEGEQNERIRIARDLHDSIGQQLSAIKMKLNQLEQTPETASAEKYLDFTIAEVRTISHNLMPEALNFGFPRAVEDLCQKMDSVSKTGINLSISEEVRNHNFLTQQSLSLYRIIQEILGNAVKYAEATLIQINLYLEKDNLIIVVNDNGKGISDSGMTKSKGLGWKNITARVNLLRGKIKVESEPAKGIKISITIPLS